MYVGWNMKDRLITVSPETSVLKAREMMDSHKVSHLPVTDGKARLLGIVTDRDLKEAWASPATTLSVYELTYVLQKLTVASVMTKDVVTASPDMTIERAAQIIHDKKFGALPVVKHGKLVGIITATDLMEVLLMALGIGDSSKRLTILVPERGKALAEIGKLLQAEKIDVLSVMTMPLHGHDGIWQLIVRISLDMYSTAAQILHQAGFKIITEFVEDVSPFLPSP
jgi:acetoin utilization protein AcuB